MAANDSNANDGEPSHLLALPVELLQCITNELGDETLTTFRLTCKAIEAATFDHFAKIFFEERHCCIYYEPRWTLLRRIVCSRIGDKIHRVIFTTDVLAPASCADLQLASAKGLIIIRRAQWNAMSNLMGAAGTRRQTPTLPSKDVIERCLRCIRDLTPRTLVEVDFEKDDPYGKEEKDVSVKANVLGAIAASKLVLTSFSAPSYDIVKVNDAVETMGYDISSCMRSVQKFAFRELPLNVNSRKVIFGYLESATELLDLHLRLCCRSRPLPDPTASSLLSVGNVFRLRNLSLTELNIDGADLIALLSRCKSTLLKVSIVLVCVSGRDSDWRTVFDTLTLMPRLSQVELKFIQQTIYDVADHHRNLDRMNSCAWYAVEGRDKLAAGLRELLAALPEVAN